MWGLYICSLYRSALLLVSPILLHYNKRVSTHSPSTANVSSSLIKSLTSSAVGPKYVACVRVLRVQTDDPWVLTKTHFHTLHSFCLFSKCPNCQTPPCLVTHTDNSIHLPNFLSCNLYIQPRRLSCCWCESVTANGTGRSCIQPSLHTSTLIRPLKWPRFPV